MEFIACNTANYHAGRTRPRWNIDAYIHRRRMGVK
jgi:hypothetical protein